MTAYVADFKYDIFISYARTNNESVDGKKEGWVDTFYKKLEYYLGQNTDKNRKIKTFRDTREISQMQLFDSVIEEGLNSSALFLALYSQGYRGSEYCQLELRHFYEKAKKEPMGLALNSNYRIVTAHLQNIPSEDWPKEFGRTEGYIFHDVKRGEKHLGYPATEYDDEIKKLASNIFQSLAAFPKTGGIQSQIIDPASGDTQNDAFELYIADVTDTQLKFRRDLVRTVKREGFSVSTGLPPPFERESHDAEVVKRLKGAELSVHILDREPGRPMGENDTTTYPQRQAELAKDNAKSQIVWVPNDLDMDQIDDDYSDYKNLLKNIDRLAIDEKKNQTKAQAAQRTHEFIRGAPQELADQILQRIDRMQKQRRASSANGILLDFFHKDIRHAAQLGGFLSQKYAVYLVPNGEQEWAATLYEQSLKRANTVLIVFGEVAETWVRARCSTALQKIVMGQCSVTGIYIYLAPPRKLIPADDFGTKVSTIAHLIHHMDSDTLMVEKLSPLLSQV